MKSTKKQKKIKVGIMGSSGRMGMELLGLLGRDEEIKAIFQPIFAVASVKELDNKGSQLKEVDVLIDFSAPANSVKTLAQCSKYNVAAIVCTTGFSSAQLKALQTAAGANCRWALVPNTSLGVFCLGEMISKLGPLLKNQGYRSYIVESHHGAKKDAPSGTALWIEEKLKSAGLRAEDNLSLRGGNEVGEHQVHILGPGERLELTHRASDRSLFARGAFRLASRILKMKGRKKPYTIDELLG